MRKEIDIKQIKLNNNNPRTIKDHKFKLLVKSLKEFPQMLKVRPIVLNKDNIVLGGNMRLKAAKEAGLKKVWVDYADDWSEEQEKEFIIKDNASFGEWLWSDLKEWNTSSLKAWGLDYFEIDNNINLDEFFEEPTNSNNNIDNNKIILEYTNEESIFIKTELLKHGKNLSKGLWNLLNK